MSRDDTPTFTLFPNLPSELRIKIWHYSLPGPRIIEVASFQESSTMSSSFFFNGAHPPSVSRVCRESRDIALSVYKPLFESDILRNSTIGLRHKALPLIYIDPAHDTIYVSTPYDPDAHKRLAYPEFAQRYPDVTSVQSVAVDLGICDDISTILTAIIRSHPKSLEEIVLVTVDGSSRSRLGVKEPEILFVEPDRDPWYGHALTEDKARDIGATLCPDICVRVMTVKTTWALAHPRKGEQELVDYDSDASFD